MDPRRPPLGALVAAAVLVGAIALLVATVAGAPPFGSAPAASPTVTPTPSVPASAPTVSPSATPASADQILAILRAIERRIAEIRELPSGSPAVAKLVTSAEAAQLLIADFRHENPADALADESALYRALGLLDPDDELGPIFERFLTSQALGFYRTDDRTLYVISDAGFGPLQEITAAHEYTHALQDEHFDLDSLLPENDDEGDRTLARLALVEGDATLAMVQWAIAELESAELGELLEEVSDPAAEEALEDAPAIVREPLAFPYVDGFALVQRAWAEGGWAEVDRLWEAPPATTEQVLHPAKYEKGEDALAVKLPAGLATRLGEGWRLELEDTAGELVTRVWLESALRPDRAAVAAAGWGGDRIGLYEGPESDSSASWAVVWLTSWDDRAESDEFAEAARVVAARLLFAGVTTRARDASVTVAIASDEGVLDRLLAALR